MVSCHADISQTHTGQLGSFLEVLERDSSVVRGEEGELMGRKGSESIA